MSKFYRNLRRSVLAMVPGSVPNVAKQKRDLERQLRAQGYSKRDALIAAGKWLSKEGKNVAQ